MLYKMNLASKNRSLEEMAGRQGDVIYPNHLHKQELIMQGKRGSGKGSCEEEEEGGGGLPCSPSASSVGSSSVVESSW